jgi:hypothetical protein
MHGARRADLVHNHQHQSGSTRKTQQGKYGTHHTLYNEQEQARVTGRWRYRTRWMGQVEGNSLLWRVVAPVAR